MQTQSQHSEDMQRLARLVDDIGVAMLTTEEPDGSLRSRPLVTLQMDGDGALWFFTSISSLKIAALDQHGRVNLSYAKADTRHFASVSGVTQVIRDPAKARELWSPVLLAWFPDGVDDPDLVLLKVVIEAAEYWDDPAGPVRRVLGLAGEAEHRKVIPAH